MKYREVKVITLKGTDVYKDASISYEENSVCIEIKGKKLCYPLRVVKKVETRSGTTV